MSVARGRPGRGEAAAADPARPEARDASDLRGADLRRDAHQDAVAFNADSPGRTLPFGGCPGLNPASIKVLHSCIGASHPHHGSCPRPGMHYHRVLVAAGLPAFAAMVLRE